MDKDSNEIPVWPGRPARTPRAPKPMSGDRKALIAVVAVVLTGGGIYFGIHQSSDSNSYQPTRQSASDVLSGHGITNSAPGSYAAPISAMSPMYGGVDLFHGTDKEIADSLVAGWDHNYHDLASMPQDVFEASWGDKTSSGFTNLMNWFTQAGMSRQDAADEASFIVQQMRAVWQVEHGQASG